MEDGIHIPLTTDTKQIDQATKSLGMLEKALNWVGKATRGNLTELAKCADVLSPIASIVPFVHAQIATHIIAPLQGAVNSFMTFGDEISKTSQRPGDF